MEVQGHGMMMLCNVLEQDAINVADESAPSGVRLARGMTDPYVCCQPSV